MNCAIEQYVRKWDVLIYFCSHHYAWKWLRMWYIDLGALACQLHTYVRSAQRAQSFYPYLYIHTAREEKAQSTIHYVIIWTNVSLYIRLIGCAMQVGQCHHTHYWLIDWLIDSTLNKNLSFLILTIIYLNHF
jgi:hypothetical protein